MNRTDSVTGQRPFDADNHYYEALDAFTRYLPADMGTRCIQWAEIGGRQHHVVGGTVSRAVVNPTFDPVAKPGVLKQYFRGNPDGDDPLEMLRARDRINPAYRDRVTRLTTMDEHGLDAMWLFPTLGMVYEDLLKHDVEAVTTTFTAFNRWLDEDWGFGSDGRIYGAPYISLADPVWAISELEWALNRGARIVVMRPAAPTTESGPRSPADPIFDPFWARVNEAGITVVVHAGDSGYTSNGYAADGFQTSFAGGIPNPIRMLQLERPIEDFLASVICDRLFIRFPNLRLASVENGSGFLRSLLRKLDVTGRKLQGWMGDDPAELFRRHVWINPFWEDDVHDLLALMGPEHVIFGSDWPHIEGMPQPLDYLDDLAGMEPAVIDQIMGQNTRFLTTPQPI